MGITKMAAGTVFRLDNDGDVFFLIKFKNLGWAKFHTNVATLTPIGKNNDLPTRPFWAALSRFCARLWICWHFFFNLMIGGNRVQSASFYGEFF